MEPYRVAFDEEAEEDLSRLDRPARKRVLTKIEWLKDNFEQIVHLPLSYEFKDFFKLRVGKWRVLYQVDYSQRKIIIAQIDIRDRIYKR